MEGVVLRPSENTFDSLWFVSFDVTLLINFEKVLGKTNFMKMIKIYNSFCLCFSFYWHIGTYSTNSQIVLSCLTIYNEHYIFVINFSKFLLLGSNRLFFSKMNFLQKIIFWNLLHLTQIHKINSANLDFFPFS